MIKQILAALAAIAVLAMLLWVLFGRSTTHNESENNHELQGGDDQSISSGAPSSQILSELGRTLVRPSAEALSPFGKLALRCPGLEELPTSGKWVYEALSAEGVTKRVSLSAGQSSVALSPGVWLLVEEPDLFRSSPVVYVVLGETTIALARSYQTYIFAVHDEYGSPIEGALLEWEAGPMVQGEEISRVTNKYGVVEVGLPVEFGILKITHPKYWTESIMLREGVGGNFAIVLSSLSQEMWKVQFIEEDGGQSIPGLTVAVVGSPGQGNNPDGRGVFTFSPRNEGVTILRIKGDNHVALDIPVNRPHTILRLPKSSKLSIHVFDDNGNPLEGARVLVQCSAPREYSGPNGGDFMPVAGESDSFGKVVLETPGQIPLEVVVNKVGYFSYLGETIAPLEGATYSVHLNDSQPLTLTLLDPNGFRVEDARILGRSLDGSIQMAAQEENGVYSFGNSAGVVSIRIEKSGYVGIAGRRRDGQIMNEIGLGGELVLMLREGYEVHGRVLWDTGEAAANVEISLIEPIMSEKEVTVIQAEGNALGWRWTATPAQSATFTNPNGEFDFFGIEIGDWEVNWKTPDGRCSVVALKYASFDFETISVPTTGQVTVVLAEPVFVVISAVDQQTGKLIPSFSLDNSHPDFVPMLTPESPVQAGFLRGWFQQRDLQYLTVVAPGYFRLPLEAASLLQVKEGELHYSVPLIPAQAVEFQVVLPEKYDEEGVTITIQAYPKSLDKLALVEEKLRRIYPISKSNSILHFDCPIENQDVQLRIDISSPKGNLRVLNPEIWIGPSDFVTIEVSLATD